MAQRAPQIQSKMQVESNMQGARSFVFATSGAMARPAGVAGMMANDTDRHPDTAVFYGQQMAMGARGKTHALRAQSPYAEIAPRRWLAREPFVHPNQKHPSAGATNEGCVDNTYQPKPMQNAMGKTRALAKNEVRVLPKKQTTDLLVVSKQCIMPPPSQTVEDMPTIRATYSRTIPFLHPIDPQRHDSGFVRQPNNIPGAKPAPNFYHLRENYVMLGDDWRLKKLKCVPICEGGCEERVCTRDRCSAPRMQVRPDCRQPKNRRRPGGDQQPAEKTRKCTSHDAASRPGRWVVARGYRLEIGAVHTKTKRKGLSTQVGGVGMGIGSDDQK